MSGKNKITVMNFSGIYRKEQFSEETDWLDVSDIPGTNCYCDEEAFGEILKRIAEFPAEGIHFIDSGNYHYMSRIWLEKITEPVTLVVFDNHTDMQPPAFGGLLSCGGWIEAALTEIPLIQRVILIGPDEEAFFQTEPELRERTDFLSRERLRAMTGEQREEFFEEKIKESSGALYISVDKDILCPGEADTSWSQGDLTLSELLEMLQTVLKCGEALGKEIVGVDICGESESSDNREENIKANRALIKCLNETKY